MKYQIHLTNDGSHTLKLQDIDESYHSVNGALTESLHIFIKNGFFPLTDNNPLDILEIGFGTGLNALLTYKAAQETNVTVNYHAIEPFPIILDTVKALNYPELTGIGRHVFEELHRTGFNKISKISDNFLFSKSKEKVEDIMLPDDSYKLIYFDLFNPSIFERLWHTEIFAKLNAASKSGAFLVTYSVKGVVKRALKEAGFHVEKLHGPPGKREMLRAVKL